MHNSDATYDYACVSADAQDLTNQVARLKAAGCTTIFLENVSGETVERPQLKKLLKALSFRDVVEVSAVDRLSRATTDRLANAREPQQAGVETETRLISALRKKRRRWVAALNVVTYTNGPRH